MIEFFLNSVPYEPELALLTKKLRIRPGSELETDWLNVVQEMTVLARPKVFYKQSSVVENHPGQVRIDNVPFHSQILSVNLKESRRVFPYLVTCGTEMAERRNGEEDIVRQFWMDAIMESALRCAMNFLLEDVRDRFELGRVAVMNPGSLSDWPIYQQAPFFELLGSGALATGVILTESMLMVPAKSTTGLIFETESGFINCQLCARETCPNRRVPFDPLAVHQFTQ